MAVGAAAAQVPGRLPGLALALVLFIAIVAAGGSAAASDDAARSAEAQAMLKLVNEARASGATCGTTSYPPVAALTWDDRLAQAARKHSEDMAAADELVHVTPTGAVNYAPGTTPGERVEQEGYEYVTMGENVAFGTASAEETLELLLDSPEHCRNLLQPDFHEIGVGRSGMYWTQNFGARP